MTVLVAAPIHECKDYAFEQYWSAYNNLTYEDRTLLLVDNTEGDSYFDKLVKCGVPWINRSQHYDNVLDTVDSAWDLIIANANHGGYEYIFSVESDIIVAPESLSLMMDAMKNYNACMVRHSYPCRKSRALLKALGCMLLRTEYFPIGSNRGNSDKAINKFIHTESRLIIHALEQKAPVVEFDHLFDIQHLEEEGAIKEESRPMTVVKVEGVRSEAKVGGA